MGTNSLSKTFLCLSLLWFCTNDVSAQKMYKFGDNSNTINDKAVLEIESTTKGFLLPRMNKMQRDLISSPPEGLMLWCTDCSLNNGSEIVVWMKDSWTNLLISNLGNNTILLGNSSGKATAVTFSGDVTVDNAGVSTIGTNKVVSAMISDGTIVSSDIASEAVITSKILDANVTNAKLDKTNIPLSGFGPAEADVSLIGYKITGLGEPLDYDDAATKNYVDTQVKAINTLENGKIYLGNASNVATEVALIGDITVDNAGISTIGTNKVVSAMISDGTIGTSDMSDNAITNAKMLDANVTFSKIQDVTSNTILGRSTAGPGSVEEIETTGNLKVVLSESPTLSGVPKAPTAALATNTDQIATTAFVLANTSIGGYKSINASQEIATASTTDEVVSGMSINPGVGVYSVMFNGQFVSSSAGTTSRGIADLSAVYQELIAYTTTNSNHAASFGNGETLTAGVYSIGGAGSIAGTLTLNGTANDLFIFKINGALTTGAGTIVNLTGGAQASNVFWLATSTGAMTIASTTKMVGTLFAKNAAATMGAETTLEGRLFSNEGAITVGPSIIKIPLGSSSINLGELSSYSLFTSTGAIYNDGISTITGNIGTNAGAVTGFDSPTTVNGSVYTPAADAGSALTSFSIYQNGTLIANSTRTKTGNNGDVSLLAIANVLEGQTIDIRWKTSLGQLKLQNRILTLIKVR